MTEKNEDGKMPENSGAAASPDEESQCGHRAPGTEAGSGREEEKTADATEPAVPEENTELEWARRYVHSGISGSQGHKVFRKTELHDRPSSPYRMGIARKKRRSARHCAEPVFQVPEEMQEFAETITGYIDRSLEDLFHEVTLVNGQFSKTEKKFRKLIRDLEWRVVDLEERGR